MWRIKGLVKWTSEQLEAVSDRNKNLLVAAAAGSGKTAVLVERIIQLIFVDEVNIDELLVVTFTHAAAGEMRDRINQAIVKKLESADGENEHLRRQLNQLSRAAISTLHAFCTEVVREYFYLIDVDPNFRIASSGDTTLLKLEALDELFAREYEQGQQDFLDLVEIFGSSRDDTPLQELVLRVYDFIQSQPSPLQWLGEKVENFALADQDFLHNPWIKSIRARIQVALDAARDIFNEALQLSTLPGGPGGYHQALQDDLSLVDRLERVLKQDFGSLYDEWAGLKHTRLGKNPREVDPELVDRCKDLRDEGKKILSTIKSEYLIKRPEDCLRDLHMLYPRMQYLYKLVAEFSDLYQELKKEKALMDFNDLEHYALSILAHEKAAAEYRKRFKYIFVDEYQDSNLVQDTIINLIKRENNLFLVGDVKQSIYRFRLADPSLFLDKYWAFANSAEEFNRRIDLSMNFRSRDEIIQGVNFIFERIMSQELGEIDYDASVFLHTGIPVRHQEKAPVELLLIENQWENNSEDEGDYKPSGYDPNEEEPGEPENDYRAGLPNQEPVEEMESLAEMKLRKWKPGWWPGELNRCTARPL
jgi:ATP-dependent helicase/nuclease subunit A